MQDAIAIFVPLFGFMLIPVWIPVLAVVGGKIADLFSPREEQAMAARLAERRAAARSAAPAPVATVTRLVTTPRHRAEQLADEVAA